jgi:hypothetical protein
MSNVPQKIPHREHKPVKIDEGFRAWYDSCPCCLSEAHPEVKRALDNEKILRAAEEAARA